MARSILREADTRSTRIKRLKWTFPKYVQAVIVWADRNHNGVGQSAAAELVTRLRKAGKKAVCVIPPFAPAPGEKTVDWDDVLRSLGLEEARKLPIVLEVPEPLRASLN